MGGPNIVFSILAIIVGVGVICYVLFRKPKAAAKLPVSEIVLGEDDIKEEPAEGEKAE